MQAFMKAVGADLVHLNAFPGACIHKTGGHPILIRTLRDRYDGNAAGERFQDSVIAPVAYSHRCSRQHTQLRSVPHKNRSSRKIFILDRVAVASQRDD